MRERTKNFPPDYNTGLNICSKEQNTCLVFNQQAECLQGEETKEWFLVSVLLMRLMPFSLSDYIEDRVFQNLETTVSNLALMTYFYMNLI